ncbi:hypothetical protein STFR1_10052 [Bacillus vallismortis]
MKNQFLCRYIVHHSTYKGEHVYAIDDFPQIQPGIFDTDPDQFTDRRNRRF